MTRTTDRACLLVWGPSCFWRLVALFSIGLGLLAAPFAASQELEQETSATHETEALAEAGHKTRIERERQRQRERAQQAAVQAAREQLKQSAQDTGAAAGTERELTQLYQRGQSLYAKGVYQEAIEALGQVVEQAPAHPLAEAARRLLAQAHEKRQVQLEAEQQAEVARERADAQQAAVQSARERLKGLTEREGEAQRQVEVARERRLKQLYRQGQTLYRKGEYQEAIETLEHMAVVDPGHPLVDAAQRLIERAELKGFEQRLRVSAELPAETRGAVVSELEDLLTHKRIEMETLFRYAQTAVRERRYDTALKLLTAVLVQDPNDREARKLMEEVQLAKLKDEREQVQSRIAQDEAAMINDVLKAQLTPPFKPPALTTPLTMPTAADRSAILAKLQEPISFEFNEVALADVLEFFADASNVSIIPSPGLDLKKQYVTLKVKDMPLERAIKYLTQSLSLAYRVEPDAILVATADEFASEPMDTRLFYLRHGLSPFVLEAAAIEPKLTMGMDSLKDLITQTVPQPSGSGLVLDERSGALIITNTSEHLALTERLLNQLDVTPIQVLIEARFVELTLTDLEELGLGGTLTKNFPFEKRDQNDGTFDDGHALAKGSGTSFPSTSRQGEGLNLTLQGVLTGVKFQEFLHVLEESKKSKTLSAPRVTTLNNQTATIRVVEEFQYPTRYEVSLIQFDINGDGDFDDAGETEFANVPQDVQKRDIGILLNVTPSVGKDLKTIALVLSPEVSQFSQFRDLGGGVTVPEFTSSQLTTSAVIENGQTIVLGGLMKDTTSESVIKVPWLGDLPIVGGLFRQKEQTSTRKNLLIFITARVIGFRGPTT